MDWTRRTALRVLTGAVAGLVAGEARGDIPRLAKIRRRAQPRVEAKFKAVGLAYPPKRLYLRAFKREGVFEMWAANGDEPMVLVASYPICAASGVLGPKRRQGDEQVPEGLYQIHRYNAWSGYHMSLRVNYPNASDRVRGNRWNLGGAIMVHGDCVTIGCIPIQNQPIEEVFLATLDASRKAREKVPIHIFPTRMDDAGMAYLKNVASTSPNGSDLLQVWQELQPFFQYFEEHRQVPGHEINRKTGVYTLIVPGSVS